MKNRKSLDYGLGLVFLLLVFAGACRKQVPPPPPSPPPPAPAPSVTMTVEPSAIERGESATLRWSSQNATELNIEPDIGSVPAEGTRSISPSESTTYSITARGPGGTAEATARLTVTAPPTPPAETAPPSSTPTVSLSEMFDREVRDAFFDFDKADVRSDARENLIRSAEFLRSNPNVSFLIEGHCDERGSVAYNLGLGDRRANAARDFLVSIGISADRIQTISYGKERPFCTEHAESCWQQNRRAHLVCNNCGR